MFMGQIKIHQIFCVLIQKNLHLVFAHEYVLDFFLKGNHYDNCYVDFFNLNTSSVEHGLKV